MATLSRTLNAPAAYPNAAAWGSGELWVYTAAGQGQYWRLNPATGAVLASFPKPNAAVEPGIGGLAWDGSQLLVSTGSPGPNTGVKIHRISPVGTLLGSTLVPENSDMHLSQTCTALGAASGGILYVGNCDAYYARSRIARVRNYVFDGYLPAPNSYNLTGISAYGSSLYVYNVLVNRIYRLNASDGSISGVWSVPLNSSNYSITSAAFDGVGIWLVDFTNAQLVRLLIP